MSGRVTRFTIGAALAAGAGVAAPAGAQVGFPPARSPFEDLEYRQNVTILMGYYAAPSDPAGVGPRSGPVLGVQYDLGFGGPVFLTTRVRTVLSERNAIDPARPADSRGLGSERRPLTIADVGLSLALTGQRSWRGLVPMAHLGAGAVSNFAPTDPGGFRFGTSFALAYGLGARYVPSGSARWSVRADVGQSLYRLKYPDGYAIAGLDGTSVVPAQSSLSRWLANTSFTAGLSYHFRR